MLPPCDAAAPTHVTLNSLKPFNGERGRVGTGELNSKQKTLRFFAFQFP